MRQEGLVPLSAAPLAFPPGAGGDPTTIRHFPIPLRPLCIGLPNSRFRHDVLRWRLHAAALCSQQRGGRGEGKPTMFFSGEVGRGQATAHCSPEIQRDTVHLWRLWGSRPVVIKKPRRLTSEQRLRSSPGGGGAFRTVLSGVLCQRSSTLAPPSFNRHLPSWPPPPQGYPPGLISPFPKRPTSKKWRPQRPSLHLWWRTGEGAYPIAWRFLRGRMMEEIVWSQAPNKVFMATPPSNWPSRTTAASALPKRPLPGPILLLLEAPLLPPLRRLGRWRTPPAPTATPPNTRWHISLAEVIWILSSLLYSNLLLVYPLFLTDIFLFVVDMIVVREKTYTFFINIDHH